MTSAMTYVVAMEIGASLFPLQQRSVQNRSGMEWARTYFSLITLVYIEEEDIPLGGMVAPETKEKADEPEWN